MRKEIEAMFPELGGLVPHEPMTREEVSAIENDLGELLPEDYRDLLQQYGAADFGELVEFRTATGENAPFSHFYGSSGGSQSLARRIKTYKDRMPDTIIPIGDDGGGNQICLGIKGTERGSVFYWDHDNEWDEDDYLEEYGEPMPPERKFQNVQLIADSFEGFIRCLARFQSHHH
jgi:hypothetical protein